jgi:integrase/recombinase XerD
LPSVNPRYFFWSGNGDPQTGCKGWRRSLVRLFEIEKIRQPDGTPKRRHAHMFRDTFAVELLNKGVPIDRVSLPLGHSSVKVTEKHYAPFVKERQQQLEMYARMAWEDTGADATAIPGGVRPGIEARLCSTQLSLRTRS